MKNKAHYLYNKINGLIFEKTYAQSRLSNAQLDQLELIYTNWETELYLKINNVKTHHKGYDEYLYEIDSIGHNPLELNYYFSVLFHSNYPNACKALKIMFDEQYKLEIITKTKRGDGVNKKTDLSTLAEKKCLIVKLTATSFTNMIFLNELELQNFHTWIKEKESRCYVENILSFNWIPFFSGGYGYRLHPLCGKKTCHKGIDIAIPCGTPIRAGHDGVVIQAETDGDYGLIVTIKGVTLEGTPLITKYAHCSMVLVFKGQSVQCGDIIAKVGNTGMSTGDHLHLKVIEKERSLNPVCFVKTGDNESINEDNTTIDCAPMDKNTFDKLIKEAKKYLGQSYIEQSKDPEKFDRAIFVCWCLTRTRIKSIATSAQGLWHECVPISPDDAMPGDLVFFTGTYSSILPITHVGIYVGNQKMIHTAKKIQYEKINTPSNIKHFYSFGRLLL